MLVTRKQISAAEKKCGECLAKCKEATEKHAAAKLELSRCKDQVLILKSEVIRRKREQLAACHAFNDCLAGRIAEKRRPATNKQIRETKETLCRLDDQIKVAKVNLSNFSGETESVEESTMRKQLIELRNDYDKHEKDYFSLLEVYANLENYGTVSQRRYESARMDYELRLFTYTQVRSELLSLQFDCGTLYIKERSEECKVRKALMEYPAVEKELIALLERYKQSRRNQLIRTCSKIKKKRMSKTKKN